MHQCPLLGSQTLCASFGGERLSHERLRREMIRRVGATSVLEQCDDLLDNDVAGIHFYTLNRSDATRTIFDSLGIPRQRNTQVPIA